MVKLAVTKNVRELRRSVNIAASMVFNVKSREKNRLGCQTRGSEGQQPNGKLGSQPKPVQSWHSGRYNLLGVRLPLRPQLTTNCYREGLFCWFFYFIRAKTTGYTHIREDVRVLIKLVGVLILFTMKRTNQPLTG